MYLIGKLKKHGASWFLRRFVREFMSPTTNVGKLFKPLSPAVYYMFSKPIHTLSRQITKSGTKSKDTLYFFYDLDIEPITYDFAWALCIANAKRVALGLRYLHIVFVPGRINGLREEEENYAKFLSRDSRIWRIYSILLPTIKLLSCENSVSICSTRDEATNVQSNAKFIYPNKYNVTFPTPYVPKEAMTFREKFMSLNADLQAKRYVSQWLEEKAANRKTIVITLREFDYTPQRNSIISEWAKFAKSLDQDKYFVVFVPDTEKAMRSIAKELETFCFFSAASWNLLLRAALYELAYINLGVNNGPMSLCWLNPNCCYITFKTAVKNVPHVPLKMLTDRGFIPGLSPEFANKYQKWVWEDDHFEIIAKEFNLMCKVIEEQ